MHLRAENIACQRGGREVFAGLSFVVASGELLLLHGKNGAGKTSLLRLIAELNEPSCGTLALDGACDDLSRGQHCHFIAHQDAQKPALTVRENLEFWAGFLGSGNVEAALDAFHLQRLADLPAGYLSAGQKRRLSLSRLKLVRRAVWLLDEPNVGLDDENCQHLQHMIENHLKHGGIIVASSHNDLGVTVSKELDFNKLAEKV